MAATTTTQVSHVNSYYDRKMLERAVQNLPHALFGQVRPIPQKNSDTIKFRRYNALSQNTTALTEGETPAGKQLAVTDVTATVSWYGDFVTLTDKLIVETFDPLTVETAAVLGQQMGESLDSVVRDAIHGGSNVVYANDASSRVTVGTNDTPLAADFDDIILSLKNDNAKPITSFVKPDNGYATTPVRPGYVAIFHPSARNLLAALTGFEHAEKYQNMATLLPGEFGRYKDIRFVESTNAKVFTGAGASSINVYSIVVFGADAYGVTKLDGVSMGMIYKDLGSGGSEDPLNQRATAGWKAAMTAKILNGDWLVRYEHSIGA